MKIAIFYHCALMGNWKQVDKEIMGKLKESGLLERADVFVKNQCKDIGLYEIPTLGMIYQFATKNPDYYILYIHTKGVSKPDSDNVKDWRACLLYWNVERWRNCIEKLDKGYDAVGIDIHDFPINHFRGNYWWAKAKHIRQLGLAQKINTKGKEKFIDERHKAEFWILSREAKTFSFYLYKDNPYITPNPRSNYEQNTNYRR